MTTTLTGEVGRTGRMEDVAIVQGLLANIEGPDGKPFWDRRIDGRPGADLAAAIEAFQWRTLGLGVTVGGSELGVVRPASPTWRALQAQFRSASGELHAVPGNRPVLYASRNPRESASDTAGRLRRGATVRERTIGHRLRLELATAVEKVAAAFGVGLVLERTVLVDDRMAMWFVPDGLSVLDDHGRPQSRERQPGDLPAALWQAVDREMTAGAAVEASGRGCYRPREGLQSLRSSDLDAALLDRYGLSPSSARGDRRPVLAVLALIARIDRLPPALHEELALILEIVAADDPDMALLLRQKRDLALQDANRQPEAMGAGPSPFAQAVDQLLRTITRNYQSSEFAHLKSLTRDWRDRGEAHDALTRLAADRKPWDIKREFPLWVRDSEEGGEYGRDVWGNLHFGYMGTAAGFLEAELLKGAGVAQYKSHVNSDPGVFEKILIMYGGEIFGTWDDPKDQSAIRLGTALWHENRFPLRRGVLIEALRRNRKVLNVQ